MSPANRHMHQSNLGTLVERFESPDRAEWQRPDWVVAQLGDLTGKTVADIGAGTGYFSFRLARTAAKVIAIDIDQRFLDYVREKNGARETALPIETRLAAEDDPRLADGEADIVLIVDTYHHIQERSRYFGAVRKTLKPGGVLAVVDFKKEELPVGPPPKIKLAPEEVVTELEAAGYVNITVDTESLPYQYLVLAEALTPRASTD